MKCFTTPPPTAVTPTLVTQLPTYPMSFTCKMTEEVGFWLLQCVLMFDPLTTPGRILRLEIDCNDGLLWVIIQSLFFSWKKRIAMKKSSLQNCLPILKAEADILSRTCHHNTAISAIDIIENNLRNPSLALP